MIEYSDLPPDAGRGTRAGRHAALPGRQPGDPPVHGRVPGAGDAAPAACRTTSRERRCRTYDPETGGQRRSRLEANALKFERFIFDALPLAERWLAVETRRDEEFAPLKNATGPIRPRRCATLKSRCSRDGCKTPASPMPGHPVELSPLFALDADDVKAKLPPGFVVEQPTYLR